MEEIVFMKKEIIQFFKSKTNVIAMLIFPIVLIFVMGKSLDGLMSMDKNIFSGKIIYFNIPIFTCDQTSFWLLSTHR